MAKNIFYPKKNYLFTYWLWNIILGIVSRSFNLTQDFLQLLQLERVQKRIADRKMKIQVTEAAIQLLGSLGYDPNYGARPVKRVIQQNVENELAKGILRGEFKEEDIILVDTEVTVLANGQIPQQKLVFRRVEADSSSAAEDRREGFPQILWTHFTAPRFSTC